MIIMSTQVKLTLFTLLALNTILIANSNLQDANSSQAVDDILKDTILLLDVLNQKVATVSNKTSNALMRDNLRELSGVHVVSDIDDAISPQSSLTSNNKQAKTLPDEEASIDKALTMLADKFNSGRKSDDLQTASSSTHLDKSIIQREKNIDKEFKTTQYRTNTEPAFKKARFLAANGHQQHLYEQESYEVNQQLASDSTERHIKFTLDLMQSMFSSQLFSPKTNLIESFLISPLSIQTVLMMMHLGARGQTRRELANCLHLNQQSTSNLSSPPNVNSELPQATSNLQQQQQQQPDKLKRRHQQTTSSSISGGGGGGGSSSSTSSENVNGKQQQSVIAKASSSSLSRQSSTQQQLISNAAHELFGNAVRNLLKDPIVTKALTSANQIFLQRNLPLSPNYESSIKHYYAADMKLVDFQHQTVASTPTLAVANQASSTATTSDKGRETHSNQTQSNTTISASSSSSSTTTTTTSNPQQAPIHNNSSAEHSNPQQMINDWVERQTRGKITNFLTSPISTSTLMIAINVLFFKGDWQYKFDISDTEQDAWFTQANGKVVKIPMMVNKLPLAFAHDPYMKTSVIELPYKAQRLGLFLLLPDEVSGIFHLMQNLNSTSFANLISSMRKPSQTQAGQQSSSNGINVRIPKFSIDSSPRLSQILSQQLGLKTLFSPDVADLSGIFFPSTNKRQYSATNSSLSNSHSDNQATPQAGLVELLHKAVLQVDEQGSVAAASSATIVERVGLFNSNYFEADHPFLLFLMDKQTGLVLFSGAFAGNNAPGGSQSSTSNNTSPNTN